ncbi:2-succinyl-5-enolpyruvyl-6-hydroxy-3-cyclohexene-1-carboxylic-acid synthase [Melioribacter sp. OK-6-Me]|uniref:2-succinyl-5-enolpyruvyl-6-hydroxy-3- cyclohexene-1-carboxylic-acid synthase n=1 Tax=unclassified Melioribacter TaxID=2627329 RepID=UPI003EDB2534
MKISVNRNTLWSELFVKRLEKLGVKNATISPGSRSTPLTLAFTNSKKIKTFQIVDERSAAFFALGMSKKTGYPSAIVVTSGTAVAEIYPAIIEAFYQRVPLIVCTADRPPELRNSGANQTINQDNIFRNHIRLFKDAGLPDVKYASLLSLINTADELFNTSYYYDRGPVHINFPFAKPFEPDSYTDKIESALLDKLSTIKLPELKPQINDIVKFNSIIDNLESHRRGLILLGYNNYDAKFIKAVIRLSKKLGYPIYADAASGYRFGNHRKDTIIENLTSLLHSKKFRNFFNPEIILQFGGTPTSNIVLHFFRDSSAKKILINRYGDRFDPSLTARTILNMQPYNFCIKALETLKGNPDNRWFNKIIKLNKEAEEIKKSFFKKSKISFEGLIPATVFENLKGEFDVMVSNSLPIRDSDFFASNQNNKITLHCNRGASGIDGITSTALGISAVSKSPTLLITGDMAFYHDMNGLHNSMKFGIPLTVILINNNGGGIFESLPISRYKKICKENFIAPLNLNFRKFVEAYGGKFITASSKAKFIQYLKASYTNRRLTVIEVKSDAGDSKILRTKFWQKIAEKIDFLIDEAENR